LPSEDFDFKEINRSQLNTKIKNQIVGCELSLDSFTNEVLNYKSFSKSPDKFILYQSISDLPESKRDLSFSVKDYSKLKLIESYILNFKDKILKKVFVFDYYNNIKEEEIKIGFRFIFQSQNKNITDKEVDLVIKKIIDKTLNYDGISIPGLH
jgi:phenylalanyl-tRNA synthetase beta subunit